MAIHSSVLAWRIPGTGEPVGLPSMGSHRVGLDGSNLAAAAVVPMVKNLPAVQKTQIESLGWEDSLERRMATHFRIFAWRSPRKQESGGLQSMGSQRVGHD